MNGSSKHGLAMSCSVLIAFAIASLADVGEQCIILQRYGSYKLLIIHQ